MDWTALLQQALPELAANVASIVHTDLTAAAAGGMSAQLDRLQLVYKQPDHAGPASLIVKRTSAHGAEQSRALGLAREADFYTLLAPAIDPECAFIPRVYYASGDRDATGLKTIVMEDLALKGGVQSGYFFGNNSMLNWGKDLATLTLPFPTVTEREVTIRAFEQAADLHASFWCDSDRLLRNQSPERQFLRAAPWIAGSNEPADRESFATSVQTARAGWDKFMAEEPRPFTPHPLVVRLMEHCLGAANYDVYTRMWKSSSSLSSSSSGGLPFTVVQGDAHPANMMVVRAPQRASGWDLVMLDWEVVGVGSGPQDLGQFAISHAAPALRRSYEREAVAVYHARLNSQLEHKAAAAGLPHTSVSADFVWREYVEGGLCRWVWLLGLLVGFPLPAPARQYFHDQVLAFCQDHAPDPTVLGMIRP
ncbi:hypothetical protein CAOG_07163 [Capsaspora owczarzaki ATCC 30864]|uniref:Aminoglycoside phosphotransferase domain-containing protein n=1 Tax=Capsaspora owczarzaki (strain ATCC 30864) TaxID=595528 RepID=A0A0D2WVM6_CAPO3|nr:hypothetical protein CAOG_07163 [Capsaspora owczarzaki ATCC 30864]KJE96915.1 hypothetical protein CAOG_007163 [Capsaspora owczarzaki ATCC 30864]|eukprot:XP_004343887.1 hypothetical protein CAOG_07163 [Capsaspora owczarzaki ATCC 30864]